MFTPAQRKEILEELRLTCGMRGNVKRRRSAVMRAEVRDHYHKHPRNFYFWSYHMRKMHGA